ncbi:hypothetical protein VB734_11850 [Synechococcus sp. BA-124 BA4]|uniref:hypothetical protein n=1 Tax=Synechococcus sp. BA-124 BA4 TaxID=3110251 RepID=UPI002B1FE615|nr:hypothetical protein [Synechococcus sp. BA-124 BA4]MEA5400731.1 hypothetical protein [Synechococcus sp. BA-124 BA4]
MSLSDTPSTPFDWTITSFRALSKVLTGDLIPEKVLNPIDSYINRVGSISCGYSGIAFHHDLPPDLVSSYQLGENERSTVPHSLLHCKEFSSARSRFFHTCTSLHERMKNPGNIYVRWMNFGKSREVTWAFPEVLDGETPERLFEIIKAGVGHSDFHLITITSKLSESVLPVCSPLTIQADQENPRIFNAILLERKGWNGDQSNSYKGDEPAWYKCFEAAFNSFTI